MYLLIQVYSFLIYKNRLNLTLSRTCSFMRLSSSWVHFYVNKILRQEPLRPKARSNTIGNQDGVRIPRINTKFQKRKYHKCLRATSDREVKRTSPLGWVTASISSLEFQLSGIWGKGRRHRQQASLMKSLMMTPRRNAFHQSSSSLPYRHEFNTALPWTVKALMASRSSPANYY